MTGLERTGGIVSYDVKTANTQCSHSNSGLSGSHRSIVWLRFFFALGERACHVLSQPASFTVAPTRRTRCVRETKCFKLTLQLLSTQRWMVKDGGMTSWRFKSPEGSTGVRSLTYEDISQYPHCPRTSHWRWQRKCHSYCRLKCLLCYVLFFFNKIGNTYITRSVVHFLLLL